MEIREISSQRCRTKIKKMNKETIIEKINTDKRNLLQHPSYMNYYETLKYFTNPENIAVQDGVKSSKKLKLWQLTDLRGCVGSSYEIVLNSLTENYGLISFLNEKDAVFLGDYGSLADTIDAI